MVLLEGLKDCIGLKGEGCLMVGKPDMTRSWGLLGGMTGMVSRGRTPLRAAFPAAKVPPGTTQAMRILNTTAKRSSSLPY